MGGFSRAAEAGLVDREIFVLPATAFPELLAEDGISSLPPSFGASFFEDEEDEDENFCFMDLSIFGCANQRQPDEQEVKTQTMV